VAEEEDTCMSYEEDKEEDTYLPLPAPCG